MTGKKEISNHTSADIWWHLPIFKLGSYLQITNNLRYPNNPDEGTCIPASMCQTIYGKKLYQEKDKNQLIESNYILPLPPSSIELCGSRVNYYHTDENLLTYKSNLANILY